MVISAVCVNQGRSQSKDLWGTIFFNINTNKIYLHLILNLNFFITYNIGFTVYSSSVSRIFYGLVHIYMYNIFYILFYYIIHIYH